MNEIFQFHACPFFQQGQFRKRQFTACNDAADSVRLQQFYRRLVMNIHHNGRMHRKMQAQRTDKLDQRKILYENRVRFYDVQIAKESLKIGQLILINEVVASFPAVLFTTNCTNTFP